MREIHTGILAAARQDADVLLLTGLSTIGGYHIAEGLGLPSMGLALQPVYPTGEFPPSIVTARSLGRLGNRAAGQALVLLGAPALAGPVRELRAELGLPRLGTREAVFGQQDTEHWPGFCCFSPAVVPRPVDWRAGLEVVGYWWPERPAGWRPPADLENFLNAGSPPVFVSFGSMTPPGGTAGRGADGDPGRPGEPGENRPGVRRCDRYRRGAARLALPPDGGGDPSCGRGHGGARAPPGNPRRKRADDRRPAILGRPARRPRHGATAHPPQAAHRPDAHHSHPGRDHPSVLPGPGAGAGQPAGPRGRHGSSRQCAHPPFELTVWP